MKMKLTTRVQRPYQEVMAGFTEELFDALAPPFPPVQVQAFGGSTTGDEVALELNFLLFRQRWVSRITDHGDDGQQAWFVDEGTELPFFLSAWEHRHLVRSAGPDACDIIDDVCFEAAPWLPNALLYPSLWAQFAYRKPIYKKFFSRKK